MFLFDCVDLQSHQRKNCVSGKRRYGIEASSITNTCSLCICKCEVNLFLKSIIVIRQFGSLYSGFKVPWGFREQKVNNLCNYVIGELKVHDEKCY